jgi:hypothetical protein
MNGIKKVLSGKRHSTSSDTSASDVAHTSPTTSVDSHEAAPTKNTTETPRFPVAASKAETYGIQTGTGRSEVVQDVEGKMKHSKGHGVPEPDLSNGQVHQSVKHLGEQVQTHKHHHEIEEVERQRNVETHTHHVQVHHQPIRDEKHHAETQHERVLPTTKINEKHASTAEDAALLAKVANTHGHRDGAIIDGARTKEIVDKGVKTNHTVHHHVTNVVVPLVDEHEHSHSRTRVVVPTEEVRHTAPVVHEALVLPTQSRSDYLSSGGVLGAKTKDISSAGLLHGGAKCDRTVDGTAERLAKELGLASGPPTPQAVA